MRSGKRLSALSLAFGVILLAPVGSLGQPPPAAPQVDQTTPRSQVPALGRPTWPDDPVPQLDFWEYFEGRWEFTWDYPDSPLGTAGTLSGTTTYSALDENFFEATTDATTTTGPVTIREVFGYLRDQHAISRSVTDSRGFSYAQIGTVGGDLGGQFTIRLDSAPFVHNGRTVRIRTIMRLLSPYNYRTQTLISVDGGPYTNYGNPWWRKEEAAQ
jgi:hypothetical protein